MSGIGAVAYVMACGFTGAGLVCALYRALHHAEAMFRTPGRSLTGTAWAFALCTFAGPWIVLTAAMRTWRKGGIPAMVFGLAGALSMLWSFCSGVVLVQLFLIAAAVLSS